MAVSFAPETIPIELLAKLARAEVATPLPLMLEMLAITLLLEIVREAGLRAPKSIGHTVSLVGALIVGETAVSAGIVRTPVLTMPRRPPSPRWRCPRCTSSRSCSACCHPAGRGVRPAGAGLRAVVILAMACGTEPFGYDYLYPLMRPAGRLARRRGAGHLEHPGRERICGGQA